MEDQYAMNKRQGILKITPCIDQIAEKHRQQLQKKMLDVKKMQLSNSNTFKNL